MEINQKILSDITVFMKYAKFLPEKYRRETWEELVQRNMEMHIRKFPDIEQEIRENYKFVFEKKVLPSMRSLQFGSKPMEINNVRGYNCSFLPINHEKCFSEIMFLLLSGTGVGYSVQKHDVEQLSPINKPKGKTKRYLVGDSIEGWADAVKVLFRSYFRGGQKIQFDFRDIRVKGAKLLTSGGKAPGPDPLKQCLFKLEMILSSKSDGDQLSPIEVHDLICNIADCVLAGGIRRAALISLFSFDDDEMVNCKSGSWWELNPQRGRANNSAVIVRNKIEKEAFMNFWQRIKASGCGEPAVFFTSDKVLGTNPCCEISLKPFCFCNLTEINASDITDQDDYESRAKAATFIGTLQASYTDFHYLRDIWKKTAEQEALLGVSMTGIASGAVLKLDMKKAAEICKIENERVADLIGIRKAARITCVKPSGSTSLVFGTSSGVHAWHDNYYIRRIRVGKNESIYGYLNQFHPELVKDEFFRPNDTAVIEVPQKAPDNAIMRSESALDLLERVKSIHSNWIRPGHNKGANTHNVSCTVSIKNDEWDKVAEWMWENRDSYSGLSVLPANDEDHGYVQAPFQEISEDEYDRLNEHLKLINLEHVFEQDDDTDLRGELACGKDGCELK